MASPAPALQPRPRYSFHGDDGRLDYAAKAPAYQDPGKFGRMFPYLSKLTVDPNDLIVLGRSMVETEAETQDPTIDNHAIPAGFTYLGQFVDHDITFDTTPLSERKTDPGAVHNFRTPKLDLDSVYGTGPGGMPHLYQRANPNLLLLGRNARSEDHLGVLVIPGTTPQFANDLQRNPEGFAIIGDPRNDENLLVAQLHVAMLKFHNKVVQHLNVDFDEGRRITTWHYQWIVLNDFVRRLTGDAVLDDVLNNGLQFFHYGVDAYMPIEFAVAAYRLGHSMVREQYDHNRFFGTNGPIGRADLRTLFAFSGRSGAGIPFPLSFEKRIPLPDNWIIDWRRFFQISPLPATAHFNFSRRLKPKITKALGDLPIGDPNPDRRNLAIRNLLRGNSLGLPSGQSIAKAMGITPLTPAEVASGNANLDIRTPLWFYILREAKVKGNNGSQLGPVGARIVAETFVGMLKADANSFLAMEPDWQPTLPSPLAGSFTMVDLLNFVGEVNPLG